MTYLPVLPTSTTSATSTKMSWFFKIPSTGWCKIQQLSNYAHEYDLIKGRPGEARPSSWPITIPERKQRFTKNLKTLNNIHPQTVLPLNTDLQIVLQASCKMCKNRISSRMGWFVCFFCKMFCRSLEKLFCSEWKENSQQHGLILAEEVPILGSIRPSSIPSNGRQWMMGPMVH